MGNEEEEGGVTAYDLAVDESKPNYHTHKPVAERGAGSSIDDRLLTSVRNLIHVQNYPNILPHFQITIDEYNDDPIPSVLSKYLI